MIIQKWNEITQKYEDYSIPNSWNTPLFSDDMNEIINCINCGKKIKYGDGYTSHRYHTRMGMGFYECEECYNDYLPQYIKSKH